MTQYIWVNMHNGAVITEESGREFRGIFDTVDGAEEFLKEWIEAYAFGYNDDFSHFQLVPIERNEAIENGEEALGNIDDVLTVGDADE